MHARPQPSGVCPVPYPPVASAKQNAPVMSSAAAARGRKATSAAALLGNAPSKFTCEQRSQIMQSENVGQAADTSQSSCHQAESTCTKLDVGDVRHQEQAGCALDHREALRGHYALVELIGATLNSSTLGNHDRPVPVQCSTIVNSGFKSVTFSPHDQDSILQFHLFEYEMSRGLRVV